ncbi:MAG: carboxypeptidase regulatory-like domain-containing protein, partial [Planctomycetaceae bacterium]|nr:carboxypeptidase regulatory-like domain-containing protein [Planctomycetaceae bacterium]
VIMMVLRLCLAAANAGRLVRNASFQKDDRVERMVQAIARQWNMRIAPVVAVTQQVLVPHVAGLFRPVILLPASAMTGLTADELSLVLAHEIAHLRRFDLWAAMLQRFAEAVLFFNPAVWFLSRRVSESREFCCDDLVCQSAASVEKNVRVRYAEALLQIVSMSAADRIDAPSLTSLAASGRSPSELRRRIARVLNESVPEPFPGGRSLLVAFGACLLCLIFPVLLPLDLRTGVNSSTTLADEQPKEKVELREFRLQVNGPDGNPLSNVECEIRGVPKIPAGDVLVGRHEKDGRYGTMLLTDERGQLHFQRPANTDSLNVFVRMPGYGPYAAEWRLADGSNGIPDSFTMELEAAWTVTGQVVDEAGKPVAGAQVSPSVDFRKRPGDERELGVGTDLTTDANGVWRYELVPHSKDYVHVGIDYPDYAPNRLSLQRAEYEAMPDVAPKTIVLAKGLSVAGTVTDENGKPIENALVRTKYANEIREAKTDLDGKYTITGCEPKVSRIVCSATGRARELHEVLIDQAMAPVNFTLPPGPHVRIRVLDDIGKGVARSRIFFQGWRGAYVDFEFDGVNEYTDDQGVWEWNDAPIDEFEADICRKNGMQMPYQLIRPRDEEYIFRPPRLLVVSGRVTDKATGELVKNFRCVHGGRNEPHRRIGENWELSDAYTSVDGTYKITRDRDVPAHMVRIEAAGYKVAVSRDIQSNEGDVEFNFELTRAPDIAIAIKTPDDQPASEADVTIGLADDQIMTKNGEFTSQTYAVRLKTDKAGVLKMPFRDQPFEIYVLHPSGFALVRSADGALPEQLTLTAWASVSGTIYSGNKPAANVPIALHTDGGFMSELCRVSGDSQTKSDVNGAYVLPRVFPGTGRIGRNIVYTVDDGATEVTSSQKLTATYVAGETTRLEIGRGGRPVIGKLTLPADFDKTVVWGRLRLELKTDLPEPFPVGLNQDDPRSFAKWQTTKEGLDYAIERTKWEARKAEHPYFHASVDRDGKFRIDNVPSGKFVLSEWLGLSNFKLAMTPRSFEVPEFDGDYEAMPLDLGEIELVSL